MQIFTYPDDADKIDRFFAPIHLADEETESTVREIIDRVRDQGDDAVIADTLALDKVSLTPATMHVSLDGLREAWEGLPEGLKKALQTAHDRIRAYHERQMLSGFAYNDSLGNRMEQRVTAIPSVGVYAPGGSAAYPSSVLMNIVPARIAGVKRIVLLTPPGLREELGGRAALGAAWLAGVDEVISVSGTAGVAALALGTETIRPVCKIVGPGNRFIATAKRLLFGKIDIDMVAGPSEVMILADDTAPLDYIAADMLSQAEHDPDAQSIAVLIGNVDPDALCREISEQTARSPRVGLIEQSLRDRGAIICTDSYDQAVLLAEAKAPEHLEILTRDARDLANRILNVGAIFVGPLTPEPMGDYVLGPNHVLPTNSTASFFSPLSVWSFLKTSHLVECSEKGFAALADAAEAIAEAEGLSAHAAAVRRRKG